MTDPIDYSRPVGWWCPVCGHDEAETNVDVLWNHPDFVVATDSATGQHVPVHICKVEGTGWCIPRYLPIHEGQRPPAASEVDEAEVVTLTFNERCWIASNETTLNVTGGADVVAGTALDTLQYCMESFQSYYVAEINRIAQASARARIVTGATE